MTLGNSLVLIQMALAMLVLTGAGLLVRTLANLKAENVGFDPQNLVVFRVDSTYSNRTGANLRSLYRDLKEQLSSLPGVTSASYSGVLLLSGGGWDARFSREAKVNLRPGPVFTGIRRFPNDNGHASPGRSPFERPGFRRKQVQRRPAPRSCE